MPLFYAGDLAHIHAEGFSALATGAAPEILRRLQSAHHRVRRVLDLGCGAGPLSAELVHAGFLVTGIDLSADLLATARQTVPRAHFIQGSLYDTPLPPCDAILAVGEPLTYHGESDPALDRVGGFFRAASLALHPGGVLIFDVIETGVPPLTARTWRSGDDWAVLVDTQERSPVLTRSIETFRAAGDLYRRGKEVHTVRLFDTPALIAQLAHYGFTAETAQAYGSYPLPPRRRAFFCTRSPLSDTCDSIDLPQP